MLSRRSWRNRAEKSRQYASLGESGTDTARRKPRRKKLHPTAPRQAPSGVVRIRQTGDSSSVVVLTSSSSSSRHHSQSHKRHPTKRDDARDDESLVANCEDGGVKDLSGAWAFAPFNAEPLEGNVSDDDYDDDGEQGSVQYIASKYYEKQQPRGGRRRSPIDHTGTLSSSARRKNQQFTFLKLSPNSSSSSSSFNGGAKILMANSSFETEETHLEEASATSISTMTSCEEDSSIIVPKKVRWLDEASEDQSKLATLHSFDCDPPVTCRVVILLLMNNGAEANDNFEFLHCEFRLDQRLKVSDALAQITELVVGTPEHPGVAATAAVSRGNNNNNVAAETSLSSASNSTDKDAAAFRPFIALYNQGRELINVCSLQDFPLQDGQSILVAVRKGKDDRDLLLKQSALLLSDKRLNKEIRKARISGRSLQVLLSSQEWREKRERKAAGSPEDEKEQSFELEGAAKDDASESSFWNLSLGAIEGVDYDFRDSAFDTTSEEHSEWFDDGFFKGTNFFLRG